MSPGRAAYVKLHTFLLKKIYGNKIVRNCLLRSYGCFSLPFCHTVPSSLHKWGKEGARQSRRELPGRETKPVHSGMTAVRGVF